MFKNEEWRENQPVKSTITILIVMVISIWLIGLPIWVYILNLDISGTWLWLLTSFDWIVAGGLFGSLMYLLFTPDSYRKYIERKADEHGITYTKETTTDELDILVNSPQKKPKVVVNLKPKVTGVKYIQKRTNGTWSVSSSKTGKSLRNVRTEKEALAIAGTFKGITSVMILRKGVWKPATGWDMVVVNVSHSPKKSIAKKKEVIVEVKDTPVSKTHQKRKQYEVRRKHNLSPKRK